MAGLPVQAVLVVVILGGAATGGYLAWAVHAHPKSSDGAPSVSHEPSLAEGFPALKILSAVGVVDAGVLAEARLIVVPTGGAPVALAHLAVRVDPGTDPAGGTVADLASRTLQVTALRDADGSVANGVANAGDLLQVTVNLGAAGAPVGSRQGFTLSLDPGDGDRAVVVLETPILPPQGIVDLQVLPSKAL